jgi:hypothetical protein
MDNVQNCDSRVYHKCFSVLNCRFVWPTSSFTAQRPSREANSRLATQQNSNHFIKLSTVCARSRHWVLSWASSIQSNPTVLFFFFAIILMVWQHQFRDCPEPCSMQGWCILFSFWGPNCVCRHSGKLYQAGASMNLPLYRTWRHKEMLFFSLLSTMHEDQHGRSLVLCWYQRFWSYVNTDCLLNSSVFLLTTDTFQV